MNEVKFDAIDCFPLPGLDIFKSIDESNIIGEIV